MSIPLPVASQFECRNETMEVYASDRRGEVLYQFNNYGYRNDIDYVETDQNVGIYLGSSITSAIGLSWSQGFARISADKLNTQCYQFSQGCVAVDNEETLRMLTDLINSGLNFKYVVVQFINLERRYTANRVTEYCSDTQENLARFYKTFSEIEKILQDRVWCFVGCDNLNHPVTASIYQHPNCVSWNFQFIDRSGVGEHPGAKWHRAVGLAVTKFLAEKIS